MYTELQRILLKYPNLPRWDWHSLSSNPNITWKFIVEHPDFNWKWDEVFLNPNMTIDIVKSLAGLTKDNWYVISQHPNITWQDIVDNSSFEWNWEGVSMNPNVTSEIILANPDKPWFPKSFFENRNLTINVCKKYNLVDLLKNMYEKDDDFLDMIEFSIPFETVKYLKENLSVPLEINIFQSIDLTWTILCEYGLDHGWQYLSDHPIITWDIIKNNQNMRWDWVEVAFNKNLTWADILEYLEIVKNKNIKEDIWMGISCNPNITIDIVLNSPSLPWNWEYLSGNSNISLDAIKKYPQFHDHWQVTQNENLTCDFLTWCFENYIGVDSSWNDELRLDNIAENWFGWTEKQGCYERFCDLVIKFKIFSNDELPKYLQLEILEECFPHNSDPGNNLSLFEKFLLL